MCNKLKSGEDVKFFSIRKVGLTVAYRRNDNVVTFGVAWKSDEDQANSVVARKIAMSRLSKFPGQAILDDGDFKERNAIVREINSLINDGVFDGVRSGKTTIRDRWNIAISSPLPDYRCEFIRNLVS
jgi:hypothetical protein